MRRIPLTPQNEPILCERAVALGEDAGAFTARLLHEAIDGSGIDELLAPFRRQIDESGASDEQLDAFGEALRDEVWREQRAGKAKRT